MNKTKPNLIYIFADQLRYQSLGYAGDDKAITPHIDTLCKESVDVCQAVSGHPVCAPYRASLLTGKYTTSTGMVINEIRMNTNHKTFADVLGENGYETAYIGKWHLYAAEWGNHYDPKNSYIPKGRDRLGFNDYFAAYNFHHEYYGEGAYYHLDSPQKIYCNQYEPDEQVDLAIEQLQRLSEGEKPFALFLSLGTPHDPWTKDNVPQAYLEKFKHTSFELPVNYLEENDKHADEWAKLNAQERSELTEWMRVYYAMVANLDDNIGRLIEAIKQKGLSENSIIVFTSDHGELFGAHGRRAKNIFYEEAVRVPFLIKWKAHLEEGGKREVCLNTVDIMPTLLTMMGLPVPEEVEGADYSACIKGEEDSDAGALMMCTGPTARFGDGQEWRAYRTKQYTYAIFKSDGSEYLFDHKLDPYQMSNLIDHKDYAAVAKALKERMWEKMREIEDTFESNTYYEQHWTSDRVIKHVRANNHLSTEKTIVDDIFWNKILQTHREITLKACIEKCETTERINNFLRSAGKLEGDFKGCYFDDSDVYKTLEGVAHTLLIKRDRELEQKADEIIDIIADAQQEDGYLVNYFILPNEEKRWTDMERHEDYCLGHMLEAAIAYQEATGKTKFFEVAKKFADHFCHMLETTKKNWVTGHQEVELALVKLYEVTQDIKYLNTASWLLEQRGHGYGKGKGIWGEGGLGIEYAQDDRPIREMEDIAGHAVRAMYMYAGMCDVAYYTKDSGYLAALDRLWESTVYRNMYITGGIGSSRHNEGFSGDYNLPNDTAYCETCASVGMILWNHRMSKLYLDSKYEDIVEKCLFNGVLSGVSLSGERFFYDNVLESKGHIQRQEWFGVSCCPTQIARFLPSIGQYIYHTSEEGIWINQYIGSHISYHSKNQPIQIKMATAYPWQGKIELSIDTEQPLEFEINLRIPGWCKKYQLSINNVSCKRMYTEKGYIKLKREWKAGDSITLVLDMPINQVIAHPNVKADAHKVAIQRGPIIYCAEEIDNPETYEVIQITDDTSFEARESEQLKGIVEVIAKGSNQQEYVFVPYYSWGNREIGKMKVWQN